MALILWNGAQVHNSQHGKFHANIPPYRAVPQHRAHFICIDDGGWAVGAKPAKVTAQHE